MLAVTLMLGFCVGAQAGGFAGGTGQADDPYRIATAEQLLSISADPNLLDKHYVLMADIDMGRSRVFEKPLIGGRWAQEAPFRGSFNGQGHAISNLVMHVPAGKGFAGLFGVIDKGATVTHLALVDVDIVGSSRSGGLTGLNLGTIELCTVTGVVKTRDWYSTAGGLAGSSSGWIVKCSASSQVEGGWAGGLVGDCEGGQITQCFSAGSVKGGPYAGGLAGSLHSSGGAIESCYSTSVVEGAMHVGGLVGYCGTGLVSTSYFAGQILMNETAKPGADLACGGLIGKREYSSVFLSYWDAESCSLPARDAGWARTSGQLRTVSTFRGWAWDGAWVLDEGGDYPRLVWEGTDGVPIPEDPVRYAGGSGAPSDPFRIETAEQMARIGYHRTEWGKHFLLVKDIDLSVLAESDMTPIGRRALPFTGSFQGAGHILGGLRIAQDGGDYVGLFGFLESRNEGFQRIEGRVERLRIEDAGVTGRQEVGILAGTNAGTISHCDVSGVVTGDSIVGSLVGYNLGVVHQCRGGGEVACVKAGGGALGYNCGIIDQSSCSADVRVQEDGGGLVGHNLDYGVIVNCLATGSVRGGEQSRCLGGLAGHGGWGGMIANCYATGSVTAGAESGSLGGLMGCGSPAPNCFFLHPADGGGPENGIGVAIDVTRLADPAAFTGWDFLGSREDGTSEIWMMPQEKGPPVLCAFQGLSPVNLAGSGTAGDPYLVASAEHLGAIVHAPDACYRLMEDIDLSGILWATAVVPAFRGHLDGAGHTITGLSMATGSQSGLIGLLEKHGTITNLTVVDACITGLGQASNVGILAGTCRGSIAGCQVTGMVIGRDALGGLVGTLDGGTVSLCCATASVVGDWDLGGLVGVNFYGAIVDCYALGTVRGAGAIVGGLVGYNCEATLERCYAAARVAGKGDVGGLVGNGGAKTGAITDCYFLRAEDGGGPDNGLGKVLTADQMRQPSSFVGWQFRNTGSGTDDAVWVVAPDVPYPLLITCESHPATSLPGRGTMFDPYQITSVDQLEAIIHQPQAHYRLANDLDLSGRQWLTAPVPVLDGSFNGAGHTIRNLRVVGGTNGGLFGVIGERATVANLRLENAQVAGPASAENMGLLAGVNFGVIRNCWTTGSVNNGCTLGGLVGVNRSGVIVQCASEATVSGIGSVGGLVGLNEGITLDCYCTGAVHGHEATSGVFARVTRDDVYHREAAGGVVGVNQGILAYAYACGPVAGAREVGGCVGYNAGTVAICYFLSPEDGGGPDNGHGMRLSQARMTSREDFVGWDFAPEGSDGARSTWFLPPNGYPCLAWQTDKSGLVWLPDVCGRSPADVEARISAAGLEPGEAIYDYDAAVPANTLIGLHPACAVPAGTKVSMVVSLGAYDWQTNPGDGTSEKPFVLAQAGHLTALAENAQLWDKHFVLSQDIDVSNRLFLHPLLSPDTDSSPYHQQCTPFQGMFDGRGHAIQGLEIVSTDDYVGLFGVIGEKGRVQDLRLQDVRTIGRLTAEFIYRDRCGTGVLANENSGTVIRCGTRGATIGSHQAGGLIARNAGTITNCSHMGLVMGGTTVGGLVAVNSGLICDSYTVAFVKGTDVVGGLVGTTEEGMSDQIEGIVNCHAGGTTIASASAEHVGGLVASDWRSQVARSYFLHSADGGGPDNNLGLALTSAQMESCESFSGWDFYGSISDGWDDPWFMPAGGPPVLSHEREMTGLVRVPDVTGLPAEEARSRLEQAGFTGGQTGQDFHRTIAAGATIGTSASAYAPAGAAVPMVVSLGRYDWKTNPGQGTAEDPYQIATASQLDSLVDQRDLWDSCFVLTGDIDLAGRSYDTALLGQCVEYHQDSGRPFNGTFDGNGHRIKNLRIMAPASRDSDGRYLGLFAWIGRRGRVMNLGLDDICVARAAGEQWREDLCGSLAGCSEGQITACCARIATIGCGNIAGLVWENRGTIVDCYTTGYMEPDPASGYFETRAGLVGRNMGTIARCYAACRITSARAGAGLVADNWGNGSITSCLWDVEISGCPTSAAGLGLTTQKMMDAETLALNGWANSVNWVIDDGRDYPRLAWEQTAGEPIGAESVGWLEGQGTAADPYRISRADQLVRLGETSALWGRHFRLTADLDLSGADFRPIGCDDSQPFRGTLDGGGHVIANVTLRRDQAIQYVGLLGCVAETGRISNVRVENMVLSAASNATWAGLLAGFNSGTVDMCSVSGSLETGGWGSSIGGLIGRNEGAVWRCRAEGQIPSAWYFDDVGGLVGTNSGRIHACYAMVSTTGGESVGGLVGSNAGIVRRSYVVGKVTAGNEETWFFGAAVGRNDEKEGVVDHCLWDRSKAGCLVSDGGLGLTTAEMMDRETLGLNGWAGDPNWVMEDGKDYPRLSWEGTAGTPITASPIDWLRGMGTKADPHRIDCVEQLLRLGRASILWNRFFVLTADLDLGGCAYQPIGSDPDLPFTGVFNGGGHVIRHLTIDVNDSALRYAGLFGAIGKGGTVDELGVEDVRLKGGSHSGYVGPVAGRNHGTISRCYAWGSVVAKIDAHNLGGLCGFNSGGTIRSCYAGTAIAAGHTSSGVGGLVGTNAGRLRGVFCTGDVAVMMNMNRFRGSLSPVTKNPTFNIGGLVGRNQGPISAALWDKETCRVAGSDGGIALTTQQMKDAQSYSLNGWGRDPNWVIDDGNSYPHLVWQGTAGEIVPEPNTAWLPGAGTADDPYRIGSVEQMVHLGVSTALWNKHFVLTADLDFSGVSPPPLGIHEHMGFNGIFDGRGNTLRHLKIERYGARAVALFGHLGPAGQIRNLGVSDARVCGYDCVAILAGGSEGSISQCFVTGTVQGGDHDSSCAAGLVALNKNGNISNCYSRVNVSGYYGAGGLVGYSHYGRIINCYTVGCVNTHDGGPLLGDQFAGSVKSSYYCSSPESEWGLIWERSGYALTETQAVQRSSYAGWDFVDATADGTQDIWWIDEGQDYPRLSWEVIQDGTAEPAGN